MKTVYLRNNIVREIIPEYALPVEKWYGADFASCCIEAPDDVLCDYIYDAASKTFSAPKQEEPSETTPTVEARLASLEAENKLLKEKVSAQADQQDFYEDCIAEMAAVVYA